jgi:BirA family biotin operon repressor/biotin-[acetyl-CoA-carboxylase] ligase
VSLAVSAVHASELYYFDQLESTNKTAEQFAKKGAADRTIVVANRQTGGKGRKGNTWYSPPDVNLYFSIILHPPMNRLHYLPFITALAIVKSLQGEGLHADIKWPNDILVSHKKIAGILIETSVEQGQLSYAIIGAGINVNQSEFPDELKSIATSILLEKETAVAREKFLPAVLSNLESFYSNLSDLTWGDLASEVEKHSTYVRGCSVTMTAGDGTVEGITAGLDSFGGLMIETPAGSKTYYAGEVQECRKK